ncbi:RNA polymerase subunit sigma-70 [Actinoplanes sp. NPDC051411]|uniref:RNA polymerase subunit sigma-70 n=1 Tax=Actinoplanes sp. NPDC051411 TaxID=3155522 RepID=UPI003421C451
MQSSLEALRGELVGFSYRMLGSPFEAEDAVQETLLRAWKHGADFDPAKGSLRTWVYRIATNVCLDMLRSARRRGLEIAGPPGAPLEDPLPENAWVLPMRDDPAEVAVRRESVRLAFVAALQHLPPRQRAVLILRDVLCWRADEVAALLEVSVAAVTSALQRAREGIRRADLDRPSPLDDAAQRDLVARYTDAFHRHDVAAMVALLHEDATFTMPPFTWWIRGRDTIGAVMAASDSCAGARLTTDFYNGTPASWQWREGEPFALLVYEFGDSLIRSVTTFLAPTLPRLSRSASAFPAYAVSPGPCGRG